MSLQKFLSEHAQAIARQDPQLQDVIMYGSHVKGKANYTDVDIALLFEDTVNKESERLFRQGLPKNENFDIISLTLEETRREGFVAREGLTLEGYSLLRETFIAHEKGFFSVGFVTYSLAHVVGSRRTRFYYALQGRKDMPGILDRIGAKKFATNTIVCNYHSVEKLREFFSVWGIEYTIVPSLIPYRLRHIILGEAKDREDPDENKK
ncbi:MAG: nucleotidyltransferase domain-containing protein [Candidatus Nanoarchaeia archaeon]